MHRVVVINMSILTFRYDVTNKDDQCDDTRSARLPYQYLLEDEWKQLKDTLVPTLIACLSVYSFLLKKLEVYTH